MAAAVTNNTVVRVLARRSGQLPVSAAVIHAGTGTVQAPVECGVPGTMSWILGTGSIRYIL